MFYTRIMKMNEIIYIEQCSHVQHTQVNIKIGRYKTLLLKFWGTSFQIDYSLIKQPKHNISPTNCVLASLSYNAAMLNVKDIIFKVNMLLNGFNNENFSKSTATAAKRRPESIFALRPQTSFTWISLITCPTIAIITNKFDSRFSLLRSP